MPNRRPSKRTEHLQLIILLLVWIGAVGPAFWTQYRAGGLFVDAQVYLRALLTFRAGGDPYQHFSQLNFVAPPVFLWTSSLLGKVLTLKGLEVVYLTLDWLAVLAIPLVLAWGYLRSSWLTAPVSVALFMCHPLQTGMTALSSGNVSNLLYAVVLGAGVPGVRRNRWIWFYVAVICAAVIKPPFLSFLLLPLFLGDGQVAACVGSVAAVACESMLERLLWPDQYKAFLDAVAYQVVVLNDSGFGFIRYFMHFHVGARIPLVHEQVAYVVHGLIMLSIVVALWRIRRRRPGFMPRNIWIATVLLTASLANPRLQHYDADILILPATLIVVEAVGELVRRKVNPLWLALPIGALAVLLERSAVPFLFFYFLIALLLAMAGVYRPDESGTRTQG